MTERDYAIRSFKEITLNEHDIQKREWICTMKR